MPYNVTVDDLSPLINYSGQWNDSYKLSTDLAYSKYSGQSFHSSGTPGSSAMFRFNGTAAYIFGAKRCSYGYYFVQVDDEQPQRFDAYPPPLFARADLPDGLHTVVITNDSGADGDRQSVDIDFIRWTSADTPPCRGLSNKTIDDEFFTYTTPGGAWSTRAQYNSYYFNETTHITQVTGATASVTFEGTGLYLYGGTLLDHGTYSIQIDNQPGITLNGSTKNFHPRALLYYADGLGSGTHSLTVINTQNRRYLDIDYVDIIQSGLNAVPGPGSVHRPNNSTRIIAGVVCGIVVSACLVLAMWYMRRRKQRLESVDLLESPINMSEVPPVGYGPANGGPGWGNTAAACRQVLAETTMHPGTANYRHLS
ncbi:hypothetical protein BDV93DRAFT_500726 [Ceratobasidium sp. AG-I]|nr:hypothetical protein BDV93DRAFT_500726 [Ceratobasidium sp. AG-I]